MTVPTELLRATRLRRRIWLPRPVYALIPYLYAVTGIIALGSAVYVPEWYWGVPLLVLIGSLALHAAFWIFSHRRKHGR